MTDQDVEQKGENLASPDIDFAFRMLLGRMPSPPSIYETLSGHSLSGLFNRITNGAEFLEKIVPLIVEDQQLPQQKFSSVPSDELLDWLAASIGLSDEQLDGLADVGDWRSLFSFMVHDEQISSSIFSARALEVLRALPPHQYVAPDQPAADAVGSIEEALAGPVVGKRGRRSRVKAGTGDAADQSESAKAPFPDQIMLEEPGAQEATPESAAKMSAKLDETDVNRLLRLATSRTTSRSGSAAPGKLFGNLLLSAFHSGQFDSVVLDAIIDDGRAPQDIELPRLERSLAHWAASKMPLSDLSIERVQAATSYRDLLLALFHDREFVRSTFPLVEPVPKIRYLRRRIEAAISRFDGSLRLSGLEASFSSRCLTGTVHGLEKGQKFQVFAQLDGPRQFLLSTGQSTEQEGEDHSFSLPLPEDVLNGQHWFAHVKLVTAKQSVVGAIRFQSKAVPATVVATAQQIAQVAPAADAEASLIGARLLVRVSDASVRDWRLIGEGLDCPASESAPDLAGKNLYLEFQVPEHLDPSGLRIVDGQGPDDWTSVDVVLRETVSPGIVLLDGLTVRGIDHRAPWATALAGFQLEIDGIAQLTAPQKPKSVPSLGERVATVYEFNLPDIVLDGQPHEIRVLRTQGEASEIVDGLTVQFDETAFGRFVGAARTEKDLLACLRRTATAGRLDLLMAYVSRDSLGVALPKILAILAVSLMREPIAGKQHPLRTLFDHLWRQATATSAEADAVLLELAEAIAVHEEPVERRVVANTAIKNASIDFAMARWKRDLKAGEAAKLATQLLVLGRLGFADLVADTALRVSPSDADLLAVKSRIAMERGQDQEAEALAEKVLAAKPVQADARVVIQRRLQVAGDHLESMRISTGGKGMTAVLSTGVPDVRLARQALPLQWFSWASRSLLGPAPSNELKRRLDNVQALQSGPGGHDPSSFSVFYLPPVLRPGGHREDFEVYGEDCRLVVTLEDQSLGAAPSLGEWTIFLKHDRPLSAENIRMVLAERRASADYYRLFRGVSDACDLFGIMVRTVWVADLGARDMAQSDLFLLERLRSVSLLMPR